MGRDGVSAPEAGEPYILQKSRIPPWNRVLGISGVRILSRWNIDENTPYNYFAVPNLLKRAFAWTS